MRRKYSFYPGCTLHSTGLEFGRSTAAACCALGIELLEIRDWCCCGASSAHSLDHELADALPARNILLAGSIDADIAIPCAACYGRFATAARRLQQDEAFRSRMQSTVDAMNTNRPTPRSLLEIITVDIPAEELRDQIRLPLTGLRPASYYGCLLLRPPETAGAWDDTEHPWRMDYLLENLGAQPRQWSFSTDCCGASMTLNRSDLVFELVGRLVDAAEEAGANCIVTACPLCQANLDTRQGRRTEPMSILYFTELIALALGSPGSEDWLSRHATDPRPLLSRLNLI